MKQIIAFIDVTEATEVVRIRTGKRGDDAV
jgi:nitrogen regulatory protein PII